MAKTLTSANSVFLLTITDLFPPPIALQGYATDEAFLTDAVALTETLMGVDGHLSGGMVFNPIKMKIKFQADSPSIAIFDAWAAAQKTARDAFRANAVITLPSTGVRYVLTTGFLTSYKPLPDAKKMLEPQEFEITWESIDRASV